MKNLYLILLLLLCFNICKGDEFYETFQPFQVPNASLVVLKNIDKYSHKGKVLNLSSYDTTNLNIDIKKSVDLFFCKR